jgi:hypothetical protein
MIVGIFMPWITTFGGTFAGYHIMGFTNEVIGFGRPRTPAISNDALLVLLPAVILILAIVTILVEIGASPANRRVNIPGLITGVVPFVGLTGFLSLAGQDAFRALEVGSYWTLIAAVGLFVASFDHSATPATITTPDVDTTGGF